MSGRNEWNRVTKPEPGQPLHSPQGKARTQEEGRRPLQSSKPEPRTK